MDELRKIIENKRRKITQKIEAVPRSTEVTEFDDNPAKVIAMNEDSLEKAKEIEKTSEKTSEIEEEEREEETSIEHKKVLSWIQKVLTKWKNEIKTSEIESTKLYEQTQEQVKPLLNLLTKNSLTRTISENLVKVVDSVERKRYKDAHNAFLLITIGSSPWPIGAKGCVVVSRAGHDRLGGSAPPSALTDETMRRCMHCIKRLLTRSQLYWPSNNPSDMVL